MKSKDVSLTSSASQVTGVVAESSDSKVKEVEREAERLAPPNTGVYPAGESLWSPCNECPRGSPCNIGMECPKGESL